MTSWLPKALRYFSSGDSDNNNFIRPKLDDFLPSASSETKKFSGVVSQLNGTEGVIENDIYFSTSICDLNIEVGTQVTGQAHRSSSHEAWRATAIFPKNRDIWADDDTPKENCEIIDNVIIGKISARHEELFFLGNYSFYTDRDNCSFPLSVGDWVRCDIENDSDLTGTLKVISINPLRRKTIHGKISHFQGRDVIVNGEILCNRSLFEETISRGSQVILDIIESDHGNYSWRAVDAKKDPLSLPSPTHQILPFASANYSGQKERTSFPFSLSVLNQILAQDNNDEQNWGISVQGTWKLSLLGLGHSDCFRITIKNESPYDRFLKNIWLHTNLSEPQVAVDDYAIGRLPTLVRGYSKFSLVVQCTAKMASENTETIIFNFEKFKIARQIHLSVGFAPLRLKKPKNNSVSLMEPRRIIQGEKPFHASHFIPTKLPSAPVPPELEKLVLGRLNEMEFSDCFIKPLNISNYQDKISHLLYLEEIESKKQMKKFAMNRATFYPVDDKLALNVPGLAEKRPSLLVGDSILASMPSADSDDESESNCIQYQGFVHEVQHSRVLLKFHREFHENFKGEDYAVSFCLNRTPLRRCHMAISHVTSQLGGSILFPKELKFQLPQVSYIDPELKSPIPSSLSLKQLNLDDKLDLKTNHINCDKLNYQLKPGKTFVNSSSSRIRSSNDKTSLTQIQTSKDPSSVTGNLSSSSTSREACTGKNSHKNGSAKGIYYCTPRIKFKRKPDLNSSNLLPKKLEWKNTSLNQEQKFAVKSIIEGSTRPLPYIILGPPGTGKTVTLVEAVLQVFLLIPHSRILVVAPSNSATDLLTTRLVKHGFITQGDLIRLNSFNRDEDSIPEHIEKFCKSTENIDVSVHHRIIVTTATTSGILYTARLKNGHFSHVFIDEAGQLTEPESAVPLGLVNSSSGQIILAGDPKQLGPVVMSSLAKQYGLGESFMNRLCLTPLYQPEGMEKLYSDTITSHDTRKNERSPSNEPGPSTVGKKDRITYEPRLVTLLVRSYRAHCVLLHVPSTLFYHSALISCASEKDCNYLLDWPELPNKTFPLLFHGIIGENMQEGDSPSWFNAAEVFQVARYTKQLLQHGVEDDKIGIITPYRKQVEKIRRMLSLFEIETQNIKVGSVEEFQGQERHAIILSTVRSTKEEIRNDVSHDMGFVLSRQRFNVAITRAKSLLVVIGNPFVLQMDPHWHTFLTYCIKNGAYVGAEINFI